MARGTRRQPGRDGSSPGGQVKVTHGPSRAPLRGGLAQRGQGRARGERNTCQAGVLLCPGADRQGGSGARQVPLPATCLPTREGSGTGTARLPEQPARQLALSRSGCCTPVRADSYPGRAGIWRASTRAGCDSTRPCPWGAGRQPSRMPESRTVVAAQPPLCPALRGALVPGDDQWLWAGWGTTKHISRWRHLSGREDGCMPRCRCARWLCRGTRGRGGERKAAAREAPSPGSRTRARPLTAGCQKGSGAAVGREGGEPGGTQPEQGSCAGLKGTASPEQSCSRRHGARVPHHRQAELAPSRGSPRLRPSRVPIHVWEQGGP